MLVWIADIMSGISVWCIMGMRCAIFVWLLGVALVCFLVLCYLVFDSLMLQVVFSRLVCKSLVDIPSYWMGSIVLGSGVCIHEGRGG